MRAVWRKRESLQNELMQEVNLSKQQEKAAAGGGESQQWRSSVESQEALLGRGMPPEGCQEGVYKSTSIRATPTTIKPRPHTHFPAHH